MAQYRGGKRNYFDDDDGNDFQPNNRGKNPFDDDEEEEGNFEDIGKSPDFLRLKQEKDLLEQRMIDSSYRSVNMINESQQIANETGTDLKIQREKLERTNKTLDSMQDDLNETDRSITSLKGIFGTMSNWFKKPIQRKAAGSNSPKEERVKGVSNGIKDCNDDIQKNLKRIDQMDVGGSHSGGAQHYDEPVSTNDIVDKNLDQMLAGLTMLKNQGVELGNEIDSQNQLLDEISSKVDKTDVRIGSQDTKIRKILK